MSRRKQQKSLGKKQGLLRTGRDRLLLVWIPVVFFLSRAVYYMAGVRFDAWDESNPMQFIFPSLMKTDLWRSVLYLQSQPPLYNIAVGTVLKLFGANANGVYATVYLLIGCVVAMLMYTLARNLGVGRVTAFAVTVLFSLSPESILYENILLYTYPVTFLLVSAALSLLHFFKTGKKRYGILFFLCLAVIAGSRSMFHLGWLLLIYGVVVLLYRGKRSVIIAIGALPVLLVVMIYAKNHYLFGTFSASSWLGSSIAKLTTSELTDEQKLKLAEEGKLSELAFIDPIQGLWTYHDKARVPSFGKTGVPIVDLEYMPGIGNNYNNPSIAAISRQYLSDALVVMQSYPGAYLRGLKKSFAIYFFPSADWFIARVTDNLRSIRYVVSIYNPLLFGQLKRCSPEEKGLPVYGEHIRDNHHVGLWIPIWYVIALAMGVIWIVRHYPARKTRFHIIVATGFCLFTILYVSFVGNVLEVIENQRFRFMTEPFVFIFAGLAIESLVARLRRIKSANPQ